MSTHEALRNEGVVGVALAANGNEGTCKAGNHRSELHHVLVPAYGKAKVIRKKTILEKPIAHHHQVECQHMKHQKQVIS